MKRVKENYKQYIEYWIKNNPDLSYEECDKLHKQYTKSTNYQCIEYYIRKYPDKTLEECEKLREEAVKQAQKKQLDKKLGQNNPCSKTNRPEHLRKQNSPYSLEYYKKRFPDLSEEEIISLRAEFISKRKYIKENHTNTLEYYIKRGYSEEEAEILRSNRQRTFSLEKCIEKYGKIEGEKVFEQRQKKWIKKLQENFTKIGDNRAHKSKQEIELVTELCRILGIEIPIKQKFITFNDKHYAYDFEYNHKFIEYNGDYWHCNPQIYHKDYVHQIKKMTAYEIWKFDEEKLNAAKQNGYDVFVVWENEYLLNKEYVIEKCINFLKS